MIDQTAKTVATHLVNNVFTVFASPTQFLTDQGTQFKSDLLRTICELFGIQQINTTAFHAQTDGLTERFNRTMADMLTSYVAENQGMWDVYLKYITLAYNVGRHTSTKYAPFTLFYGREASLPTDVTPPLRYRSTENQEDVICQQWSLALKIAKENLLQAQLKQKKYYDDNTVITQYQEGELILLREPSKPGKFIMNWEGPHKVLKKLSDLTYQIKDIEKHRVQIVHVNRMKRWKIAEQHRVDTNRTDEAGITNLEETVQQPRGGPTEKGNRPNIMVPAGKEDEADNKVNKSNKKLTVEGEIPEMVHRNQDGVSILESSSNFRKEEDRDNINPTIKERKKPGISHHKPQRKRGRPRKTVFVKPVVVTMDRETDQYPIGRYNLRRRPQQTRF
jgi:hypothetical protein